MLKKAGETVEGALGSNATQQTRPTTGSVIARAIAQVVVMALILGVAYLATWQLARTRPEPPSRPPFPTIYTVESAVAEKGAHQPVFTVYGEVVAARSVDLRSLVSGVVTSVNRKLKVGGMIEAGQTLLEVDRFSYEGALREAKANEAEARARIDEADARIRIEKSRLSRAREQLALAKSDAERIKQLRKQGTVTQKQVDDRMLILSQREQAAEQSEISIVAETARISQLQANLTRLVWRVEQADRNLANTELIAPFTGTIRSSKAETGKLVSANDIVVSMYQAENLEARFVLSDERFGRLQADEAGIAGRPVAIRWRVGGTDLEYEGAIDRIGAEITSATGGIEVFARIGGGDGAMRPGAFVEITVPDSTFHDHFRLPDSTLYEGNTVYVIERGKLVARSVTIAAYDGEYVLISAGIEPGDEVLTTRIAEISAGLRVRKEGDPVGEPPAKKARKGEGGNG